MPIPVKESDIDSNFKVEFMKAGGGFLMSRVSVICFRNIYILTSRDIYNLEKKCLIEEKKKREKCSLGCPWISNAEGKFRFNLLIDMINNV